MIKPDCIKPIILNYKHKALITGPNYHTYVAIMPMSSFVINLLTHVQSIYHLYRELTHSNISLMLKLVCIFAKFLLDEMREIFE